MTNGEAREPTAEEREAAEKVVDEAIKRFQQERDRKPNPLTQPVKWGSDGK